MVTTSTVVHNLPRQTTSFIGRQQEIADIIALLDNPDCQLLTLVGPGGIGKTRLAIEVARQTLPAFPDGVWFVPLTSLTSADQIPTAIIKALQIQSSGSLAAGDELLGFLRDQHLLLVLDNFEHLLEGAEFVNELLLAAPEIKILVTSRATLNLRSEWIHPIGGMRYPDGGTGDSLEDFSAVQLFGVRARQVQPEFDQVAVSDSTIRICQLVEGLPLAIEMAAAWLKVVSCETIITQLQRNLDFLSSDLSDVPDRHRSMRAVCDHSWMLLTDDEQQVFRRFSVFHGGCTLEAAEQVTGASLTVLASLVEKSLLVLDSQGRYQTHELLRQYAQEKLEVDAGVLNATLDAHCAYFAQFMHQREADIKGRRQLEALDEIEIDFENVRRAWLWALERHDCEGIDQMLEALDLFCQMRGRVKGGRALFAQAQTMLAPDGDESPHRVWGRVLARPDFLITLEDFDPRHKDERERALAIARQYDDRLELAVCLYRLGELGVQSPPTLDEPLNYRQAVAYLEESLALFRAEGDRFWTARTLNELGIYHFLVNEFDKLIPYSREALGLRQAVGDKVGMAWCLQELGSAYFFTGWPDEAKRCWNEGLKHFREAENLYGLEKLYDWLSYAHFSEGDFEHIQVLNDEWLRLRSAYRYTGHERYLTIYFGWVAGIQGDYEECRSICTKVLDSTAKTDTSFSSRLSSVYEEIFAHFGLAISAYGLADWAGGGWSLREVVSDQLLRHIFVRELVAPILSCLAAIWLSQANELEQAVEWLGLTFSFPSYRIGWVKRWSLTADLADALEKQLGEDAYATAWERGQKLAIDDVIVTLRARFGVNVDAQQQVNDALDDPLTPRELEVLNLIYAGHTNREIADELVLAESTVKRHINHIYSKLAVESRTQALARAREFGLLQ